MNIDLKLQDWSLALTGACVRQYDDRAQTVCVTGDIPEQWSWKLCVGVHGEAYFNAIPLTESEGALSAVLTRDDLAFGDTFYTVQLVGEKGDVTRHTNPVRLYVGASLSGDGVWPEIPRSFTDAEAAARAAAETAVSASTASMARLDRLATFGEGSGGTIEVPDYVNQIPVSTDASGAVYNGTGYHSGWRFNSSGTEVADADLAVTGFISATRESVLRFARIGLYAAAHDGVSANKCYIVFYDSGRSVLRVLQLREIYAMVPDSMTLEEDAVTLLDLSATLDTPSRAAPEGTAFVRFSAYGVTHDSVITVDEALTTHSETLPSPDGVALRPEVHVPLAAQNAQRISALETAAAAPEPEPGVLETCAGQIDRALTIGYQPVLTGAQAPMSARAPLNFLHISDTHGSTNLNRAVTVLNKLAADGRCACMVHTGDLHASTFASDYTPVQAALDAAEAPVLLVTGNHDAGNNQRTVADTATDAQLYDRMFAPVIDSWEVTSHPEGKCYWYRDFAASGVRLIGLHDFESDYDVDPDTGLLRYKRGFAAYHQAQIDWLIGALMTCPADYGVIIAKHNPVNVRGTLENPFNSPYLAGRNTAQSYVSTDLIADIVQAFMDGEAIDRTYTQTQGVVTTLTVQADFSAKNAGAEFVCYLDGHTHADGVSFLKDYPRQLELNIGADNFHYQHYADTFNQQGTQHQDLMNYVSVNRNFGYVYLLRIGNDFSARASRRDYTAIDYRNPPVRTAAGEELLEPILSYTCDGTELNDPPFYLREDNNGNPFRLKKLVMLVRLGTVDAAGTFSANALSDAKVLAQAYSSYGASASGQQYELVCRQDGGYWRMEQFPFSSATGSIGYNHDYDYRTAVSGYPYINCVRLTRPVPAGTVIQLLGVRV